MVFTTYQLRTCKGGIIASVALSLALSTKIARVNRRSKQLVNNPNIC